MKGALSEHDEQKLFVQWFRTQFPGVLIFAVPNGAHLAGDAIRRAIKMRRMKAEGLVEGIPDLCVPEWRLWIEMKRQKGGKVSDAQETVHGYLRSIGHHVIVAKGWDDARAQTLEFARAVEHFGAFASTNADTWTPIGDLAAAAVRRLPR